MKVKNNKNNQIKNLFKSLLSRNLLSFWYWRVIDNSLLITLWFEDPWSETVARKKFIYFNKTHINLLKISKNIPNQTSYR